MIATIVLNDMDRTREATYGYRSWLLQDISQPYEVVLNLFNDQRPLFEALAKDGNLRCTIKTNVFPPPKFFNISAANNIGLHFATGKYVIFANSDIIYPSHYLRLLVEELDRRQICYAIGAARVNLSAAQTRALAEPVQYTSHGNFDFLVGCENLPGRVLLHGLAPWVVLGQVARQIGGYDPLVLCHEDSEFNDRVMHYLRRTGQQQCLYAIHDLYGYHLHHPGSELYHLSALAKAVLEPRRLRLLENPNSTEDIVPTNLDSLEALLQDQIKWLQHLK